MVKLQLENAGCCKSARRNRMDKIKELEQQLKRAGKLDKLPILRELMKLQNQNRELEIFQHFQTALHIFQDYLQFDKNPPQTVCQNLAEIFYQAFQAVRNYDHGRHFSQVYNPFLQWEKQFPQNDCLASIYADLNFLFWMQNKLDEALKYGTKSLAILEKSGNHNILPGRYSNIGYIYESKGEFDKAEQFYEKGLRYGLSIHSENVISLAYCGFGRLHIARGNFKSAIHYFLEALNYFPDTKSPNYMAVCCNLGNAYGKIHQFDESIVYLSKFINRETKAKDPNMYFALLMNAANSYEGLGKLDKTESYLLEIIEFFEHHKNPHMTAAALLNLGRLENNKNHSQKALEYYKQSVKYIKLTNDKQQNISAEMGLGITYIALEDFEKAKYYLETALAKAEELGLKAKMRGCHFHLSKLFEKKEEFELALLHHKKMNQYELEIREDKYKLDLKNVEEQYKKEIQKPKNLQINIVDSYISKELAKLVNNPLIGSNPKMREAVNKAMISAKNDTIPVLITGESGTGKEIIARIIHFAGKRKNHPFLSLNSVAFAGTLIESTFFGNEKGAFTGAEARKTGYFEAADKGTLFLDEIGDMSLSMQTKLLRVIEERVIHRVGGTKDIPLDFRLLSATNKNLYQLSQENLFRFDLLNRINTFEIHLPPLRERKDDIPLLIDYYFSLFTQRAHKPILKKTALDLLLDYDYPGNVRELKNILQRTLLLCDKAMIEPEDIAFPSQKTDSTSLPNTDFPTLNLAETEKRMIEKAMRVSGNVQVKAAKLLGISPYSLNRKLKKMG
jgi:transcriptional regulator with PAS, ATPase and Fis domain